MTVAVTLSSRDYDAVLFDLDGVLTRTARVHAAAWKRLFDGFLEQRATEAGTPFAPSPSGRPAAGGTRCASSSSARSRCAAARACW